jgi:NAD(P)-dependent dehydrogenase (short-subunit alcohol dehydrogenase family)
MDIKNKIALVTGSGIRLGRAIALSLAEKGCNLALHYHSSQKDAEELKNSVERMGVEAELFQADLGNPENAKNLISDVIDRFGSLEILVNNAGLYGRGRGLATDLSRLEEQFRLNLFTPILLIRTFAEALASDSQGKVVNIADAKVLQIGYDHFAYRLTKRGLIDITRMFALELAPRITVNAVAPGVMMPLAGFEDADMDARAQRLIPLKRIGAPEFVAQNVLHLLEQDFMTGVVLPVDGGENI